MLGRAVRAEQLIAVAPNGGIRTPDVTAEETISFCEVRLVIEPSIVATIAGHLTIGQTAAIETIIAEQARAAAEGDTGRYHRLDLDFHTALAEFHGDAEMVHAPKRLRDEMCRLSRRMHRAHPERLGPNAARHRAIMEAVRDGEAGRARREMERHLDRARSFTLDPDGRLKPQGVPAGRPKPRGRHPPGAGEASRGPPRRPDADPAETTAPVRQAVARSGHHADRKISGPDD